MRVLVVGAGIGGLTAALALRQSGFDAHVYEQARVLREVGRGSRARRERGQGPAPAGARRGAPGGRCSLGVVGLSRLAERRGPRPGAARRRGGGPLGRAVLQRASGGPPRCASGRASAMSTSRSGRVACRSSSTATRWRSASPMGAARRGDLLVGADGIHSVVREYVAGPDQPTWWPQIAWRGLVPGGGGARGRAGDAPAHVRWAAQVVRDLLRLVGSVRELDRPTPSDGWREESWSARGDRDEALALFDGWHHQVRALIADTEQVFKWAMFDRPSLETWNRGRVTLLGDAAHPMLPFMGQGAAQSIEDAAALALCLAADRDDPQRAIATYVGLRSERAAALQAASREQGPRSAAQRRGGSRGPKHADARQPGDPPHNIRLGVGRTTSNRPSMRANRSAGVAGCADSRGRWLRRR